LVRDSKARLRRQQCHEAGGCNHLCRRHTQAKPNSNPRARSASQRGPHHAHSSAVQAPLSRPLMRKSSQPGNCSAWQRRIRVQRRRSAAPFRDKRKQLDELILLEGAKFLAQTTNDRTCWLVNRARAGKAPDFALFSYAFCRANHINRTRPRQEVQGPSMKPIPLRPKLSYPQYPLAKIRKAVLEPWTLAGSQRDFKRGSNSLRGKRAPPTAVANDCSLGLNSSVMNHGHWLRVRPAGGG
jgi:hypothetical protein